MDIECKDESSSPKSNWMSDDSLVLSTEEQKGKDDFDLGHTETLEQKLKKAYYGRSGWVLGSPIP